MATKKKAATKVDSTSNPVAKKAAKVAKKAAATKAPGAPAKKAAAKKSAPSKPSLDLVARAAYLNYRRRVEQGLPGDSHGDWLEAERQMG